MIQCYPCVAVCVLLGLAACRRNEPATAAPGKNDKPAPAAAKPSAPSVPLDKLLEAAMNGDVDVVRGAVRDAAAANQADADGRTPLMMAAFNGHMPVMDLLLQAGARIDERDSNGRTALMFASSGPNDGAVALLIKRGAMVNLADKVEHWTPLMFAAAEGHRDVARRLLDAGADPTAVDIDGDGAATFARNNGHAGVADMIDQAKARRPTGK